MKSRKTLRPSAAELAKVGISSDFVMESEVRERFPLAEQSHALWTALRARAQATGDETDLTTMYLATAILAIEESRGFRTLFGERGIAQRVSIEPESLLELRKSVEAFIRSPGLFHVHLAGDPPGKEGDFDRKAAKELERDAKTMCRELRLRRKSPEVVAEHLLMCVRLAGLRRSEPVAKERKQFATWLEQTGGKDTELVVKRALKASGVPELEAVRVTRHSKKLESRKKKHAP